MNTKVIIALIILVVTHTAAYLVGQKYIIGTTQEETKSDQKDSLEESKGTETTHRVTTLPDGTIIEEDIIKDFFIRRLESENIELKKKLTEVKQPNWHVALIPTYSFKDSFKPENIKYNILIERRITEQCYAGVLAGKDQVGGSIGCYF